MFYKRILNIQFYAKTHVPEEFEFVYIREISYMFSLKAILSKVAVRTSGLNSTFLVSIHILHWYIIEN